MKIIIPATDRPASLTIEVYFDGSASAQIFDQPKKGKVMMMTIELSKESVLMLRDELIKETA